MIEQIDKETPNLRKFICEHYCASEMRDMDDFITNVIGSYPEIYEIISLMRNDRVGGYELFYKRYIYNG